MAQISVRLRSGETVPMTYPDDWSTEQVESAIHESFPDEGGEKGGQESSIPETPFNDRESEPLKMKERIDSKSLMSDLVHSLGKSLREGKDFAVKTPGMVKSFAKHLKEHPLQALKHDAGQLLAGTAESAKNLANLGLSAGSWGLKHLDPVGTSLLEREGKNIEAPQIPEDTGVEKLLGLQPTQKEDRLIRAIPDIYGGSKLIGEGIGKVKKFATAPSKSKLFQRALEERVNQAGEKKTVSEADLKQLQDSLKLDYSTIHPEELGEATPLSLKQKINIKKQKLADKKPLTEIPEREVGEIPEAPDTKAMLEEHQELIDKAKSEAEKTVGIKENPSLKAGNKIKSSIEDLEKSSSDIYNSARNHYINEKITADNSADIKAASNELETLKDADELAPGYGSGTADQKALQENIDALKGKKVQASDVFSLMRTSQQLANKFRMKRKGVNEIEWQRLTKIADNLDNHAERLAKRLEEVGGQDVRSLIKQANKGYRTFKELTVGSYDKGVFKTNPVGKAAFKSGNIPNNALIKLAEDNPANEFLNALVESDPELRKNLLAAYSGESNVNKLTNPTSLTKKYIQSLPEVEERLVAFQRSLADYKVGEKSAAKINKAHDDLVKSMKGAAKEQKVRQDAIEESDKLKKQIKFKEDALPKIEAKINKVEANSAEHQKLKKELDEYKKFIQDKGGRLKELAHFFVKVKLAGKVHL